MMKMKTSLAFLATALLFALTGTAWANDSITSTVTDPTAVITNNGADNGNVTVQYTLTATSWGCPDNTSIVNLHTFTLNLADMSGSTPHATYPFNLTLNQDNGDVKDLKLSASPASFSITSGWTGSSTVTVSIDCSKPSLHSPADGQTVTAMLDESKETHLGTANVKVQVKLAFPTSCLKVYSFETYQDTGDLLDSVNVVANKTGSVKATNPGTISSDALVVNTCGTSQPFDLGVTLDPHWQTIPNDNPGNAVFTYENLGDTVTPEDLGVTFGTGTPGGEQTCLHNITLQANQALLVTVHSQIASGIVLGTDIPTSGTFNFSSALYNAGDGCSDPSQLLSGVDTTNDSSILSYTAQ